MPECCVTKGGVSARNGKPLQRRWGSKCYFFCYVLLNDPKGVAKPNI